MDILEQFIQQFGGLTEEYEFYGGTVKLRYDPKDHVYLLVKEDGTLEVVHGVTSVCHIIDKSVVLIPWACKMMAQKLSLLLPTEVSDAVEYVGTWDGSAISPIKRRELEDLIDKAKTAHKDKLDEAGDIGHFAHSWIENYIKAILNEDEAGRQLLLENKPYDERARNACNAALDWMHHHNVKWISTERKIYSRKHKYAGTMDGLCYVDSCSDPLCCPNPFKNRLSIADWKTSNYLYPEYLMQTASYEAAYEEETGEDVKDRWIIRLGKEDAKFETWHIEHECFHADFQAFLAALDLRRKYDLLEERLIDLKDIYRKGRKKMKEDALAIKCKKADSYKGIRKPSCNNGVPCAVCLKKYEDYQAAKHKKIEDKQKAKPVKLTQEQIIKSLQDLVKKP